jgi:hypothetical protein
MFPRVVRLGLPSKGSGNELRCADLQASFSNATLVAAVASNATAAAELALNFRATVVALLGIPEVGPFRAH